jgi:Na+-transporting NADH:ubiquinone oxidoreductase subunit NqrC
MRAPEPLHFDESPESDAIQLIALALSVIGVIVISGVFIFFFAMQAEAAQSIDRVNEITEAALSQLQGVQP